MFHKKKAPDEPFTHAPDCKTVRSDPGVQIPWGEIRSGVWEARCVCGVQYHHDPFIDDRVRLDPLDPKTARHAGQCEFNGVDSSGPVLIAPRENRPTRADVGRGRSHACAART
jgi:hypothetical protein